MSTKRRHRSFWKAIHAGWPSNLHAAMMWLFYTFIGSSLSFLVGAAINLLNSGRANHPSLIRHGELFAVSASLLVGSMRLVSKDDGSSLFLGRQIFAGLVFATASIAQLGYVLLKLSVDSGTKEGFAHLFSIASLFLCAFVVGLVFVINLLDASRSSAEESVSKIDKDFEGLSKAMGAEK